MAVELAVHPNTPQILVRNNEDYLYFNNNPKLMHSLLSEAILLERIGAEFHGIHTSGRSEERRDSRIPTCGK